MPTLGAPLDFVKNEARNLRAHILSTAPSTPSTGQMYYNSGDNTLYWWDGTSWVSARGGASATPQATASTQGTIQLAGDLAGSATAPTVAAGAITDTKVASANKDGTAITPSLRTLGTGALQAAAGNDSRLTDSRTPTGIATGDLTGTYPNPTVAASAITDTKVAAANKDGTAAVPSMRTLGTGALQAAAGNDARFTDSRTPTGAAGGDLTGSTYPNPVIANGAVTSAKIADGTITDTDVAAANKDGAVAVPSLRTLGSGAAQAMPGNRTLDAIIAPTASLNLNSQKIISVADPTSAQDAATKNYVDNLSAGLDAKGSVHAATTANIATLAGGAPNTLDGIALVVNDRVLVKDQTTASQNGIYTVTTLGTGANGTWTRSTDMDTWAEVPAAFCWVEQGTVNGDSGWVCTADPGGTLGTTSITWTQFTGTYQITDGIGLLKTGNVLDVRVDNTSIEAPADILQVKAGGITNAMLAGLIDLTTKVTGVLPLTNGGTGSSTAAGSRTSLGAAGYYSNNATHGAGTTITITGATHGLGAKRGIHVQVQDNTTGVVELPDVSVAANGDVTVTYSASVSANTKLVTLVG